MDPILFRQVVFPAVCIGALLAMALGTAMTLFFSWLIMRGEKGWVRCQLDNLLMLFLGVLATTMFSVFGYYLL